MERIKVRIEVNEPRSLNRVLSRATDPVWRVANVQIEKIGTVFTCFVPVDAVFELFETLREQFPKAYYQGWTVPGTERDDKD